MKRKSIAMIDSAQPGQALEQRAAIIDWDSIKTGLNSYGVATTGPLLNEGECEALRSGYGRQELYRSRVIMARHGFGRGEYQYFAAPLPAQIGSLRSSFYRHLAPIANAWETALKRVAPFPEEHAEYLHHCHKAGQKKPTPLILKYQAGDYNCLHQDIYGDLVFPFQMAFLLSKPGKDFTGGEFVLTEQRPRMQSRAEVVTLRQGEGVIFPVHHRPVQGTRGTYRTAMRHGVSRIRSGTRFTLGIIFHDAA